MHRAKRPVSQQLLYALNRESAV